MVAGARPLHLSYDALSGVHLNRAVMTNSTGETESRELIRAHN